MPLDVGEDEVLDDGDFVVWLPPGTTCVVVTSVGELLLSDCVGVGVCAGVFEVVVSSVGFVVLVVFCGGVLLDVVGVGVGVVEALVVGALDSVGDGVVVGVVVAAAVPPNNPSTAELIPPSRSFFSTISRRKGFESSQLACASATKTVNRVKTRTCCRENNMFAMVLYV